MSFRTDKIRGAHPITPKKGIKEVDLNIKEKGNNDTIAVSIKPTKGMKGNRGLSREDIKLAKEKTKYWNLEDWEGHKKHQIRNGEPYLFFNEHGIQIMNPEDMDYNRDLKKNYK